MVDFSELFATIFNKNISAKIQEFDFTLNKLESSVLGTIINYNGPYKDDDRFMDSSLILKVGDKIYKLSSSDGEEIKGVYESDTATYDMFKIRRI